ncbi:MULTISPECIES: glycerophosphodiester phosphodiesterase family protein [Vibrio]|uniref:Glycerophosphoryl diester phosphodiesterase n=1 Tax=Vibrio bivalvicida TaxID=1276888 RepID=A0A177Y667_9VIBR|nr:MULTISPECIES: glycerophosphodiester phosphodiesterase family protein [Vibrio]KLN64523.1 glycerophosphodiester phosphodiesterase [Vibrio sp. VPAP30]OAJ96247.1 glycerophosphoryl diester phosphodiesterase [Vibrio bivalvicida]
MIIVGHRGVAGHYPENTRSSIEAAIKLGLEWVEVDIQPTKDNHLVICHDHTINRCSDGVGRLDSLTLEQLKQYDFGQWFDKRFSHESILSLSELLQMSAEHNLKLNLEIKIDRHDPQFVCQRLKQQLKEAKVDPHQIVISSFSHQIIHQLYQQLPQYKIGVLCNRLDSKTKQLLKQVGAFSCNINYRWANKRLVEHLKAQGYQVWSYTVNNPGSLKHLPNLDAIFSDYPERFL